jgi:class 3 adenylate cyclase
VRRDLPTGTVTFLFTDVEGSTKLLAEIGDEAYDEALAEHRRVVRRACVARGGLEIDTQGDAFFFAFPNAPGALAAASEVTTAVASGPIRVRIGLHTGKPRLSDEGYVGKEVHFAARLAASGHGGQIVLSKGNGRARRWLAHRTRGTPAQRHRRVRPRLPTRRRALPSSQDDFEHQPSAPCLLAAFARVAEKELPAEAVTASGGNPGSGRASRLSLQLGSWL